MKKGEVDINKISPITPSLYTPVIIFKYRHWFKTPIYYPERDMLFGKFIFFAEVHIYIIQPYIRVNLDMLSVVVTRPFIWLENEF